MIRLPFFFTLALFWAAPVLGAEIDRQKLYDHIHKSFSTPSGLKIKLRGLRPGPIKGFLKGTIVFTHQGGTRNHEIMISENGRHYILGPLYGTRDSAVPGLREVFAQPDQPPPPGAGLYLSDDGKHLLVGYGKAQDLTQDPDQANREKLKLGKAFGQGPRGAPVVLVEFSDLQCPFCRKVHKILEAKLAKTYGKKVRWISKHYPLRNHHPWAYDAAIAVSCAGIQQAAAYHQLQSEIIEEQKAITTANLRKKVLGHAAKAKLDLKVFTRCFDKKESAKLVDADIAEGNSLGVDSTPTVFINGRKANPGSFETLRDVIDEMLAGR